MVSKLMKVYSTLSQATESIITEQGSPKVWNINVNALYSAYKSKLRISKDCGSGTGCWHAGKSKGLNGNASAFDWNAASSVRKVIMSDGTSLVFEFKSNACADTADGRTNGCSLFVVDLNGRKAPNQIGRDVYWFVLKENGLAPNGCDQEGYCNASSSDSTKGGVGCACKVISEGAINY